MRHLRHVTRSGLLRAGAAVFFLLASTALAVECESNQPSTLAHVPSEVSSTTASTVPFAVATMFAAYQGTSV